MFLLDKIFKTDNQRLLAKINSGVEEVNNYESSLSQLTVEQLKFKTTEFKDRLQKGETLDDICYEAFATVREVAKRTLKQRHFNVQLLGGLALNKGMVAEMKTGEGKTLVATLSAYLNALEGKGVHIITVNDYLAQRDAVLMGQIYSFLGISVGVINSNQKSFIYDEIGSDEDKERDAEGYFKVVHEFLKPTSRSEAYSADITYGTNNEFAFDYLHDNLVYTKDKLVQRGFHYAIVDEVDSILIDEARSPLIISSPSKTPETFYTNFTKLAKMMEADVDYKVDEKAHSATLTEKGIQKAEQALKIENLYVEGGQRIIHYLENALKAKSLYKRDKQYVVRGREVIIVDEFTGRLQHGRRWSEGLHQAVEAKEGVTVQAEVKSVASITFQNFFRMYKKLSGMTGTASSSAEEFYTVYGLEVVSIPTDKKMIRQDYDDSVYATEDGKIQAIVKKVKELNERGQPVLIGTSSIHHNEKIAKRLSKAKIKCIVLNAKNHESEGEIIAQAGRKEQVTIATNLAGRGVDIKLGGIPFEEAKYKEVKGSGGLFVLGTERHEARRIDNQLRGRSGRQGDEGETQFFVSLEDKLMRVFGSPQIRTMIEKLGLPADQEIKNRIITKAIESAQARIEGHYFDARRASLRFDNVLDKQRDEVYQQRRLLLLSPDEEFLKVENPLIAKSEITLKTIEDKKGELKEQFVKSYKMLALQAIDVAWSEHLELMGYAKSSVQLRGADKAFSEYKREATMLFSGIWGRVSTIIEKSITNLKPIEELQKAS